MKTKIFRVTPVALERINRFLDKSSTGTILRQEFATDEKGNLYLMCTICEKEK